MKKVTLVIGADHRGYHYKEMLKHIDELSGYTISWIDVGAFTDERSDYPLFAHKAIEVLQEKKADLAVLLCGSGIGMALAANRYTKVYAGVVWNREVARQAREDDNVNVLVIPADYVDAETTRAMLCAWLGATFKKGRYEERIAMIDAL